LKRSNDIGSLVIVTEEAIAKGIRRIVAVTGVEATRVCAAFMCVISFPDCNAGGYVVNTVTVFVG